MSAFTHAINDSLQCCRRLRLRSRWTSWNTFWRRVCALRTSAQVTAPCQCRWRSSVSHCLFACVKARNSQLYLLLFEPAQVVMDGVLFLHATSIASCRSTVGHAVPRYGLPRLPPPSLARCSRWREWAPPCAPCDSYRFRVTRTARFFFRAPRLMSNRGIFNKTHLSLSAGCKACNVAST